MIKTGAQKGQRAMFKNLIKHTLKLSMKGFERGPHMTRYTMYERMERHRFTPEPGARVLSVSHSTKLCARMGLGDCQIDEANFPDHDLLDLKGFEDGAYDFIVSDQVLEHVQGNPKLAMEESLRVLKPGGIAIHTTCFINPVHDYPHDYWRFTPNALELLCEDFGEVIDCDGWGNFSVWLLERVGLRYEKLPAAKWHPLTKLAIRDDPEWPIVTWIIARK
jgi:SAM-dependent methyltransferase